MVADPVTLAVFGGLGAAQGVYSAISMGKKNRRFAKQIRAAYQSQTAQQAEADALAFRNFGARARAHEGNVLATDRGTGTRNKQLAISQSFLQGLFETQSRQIESKNANQSARDSYTSRLGEMGENNWLLSGLQGALSGMTMLYTMAGMFDGTEPIGESITGEGGAKVT